DESFIAQLCARVLQTLGTVESLTNGIAARQVAFNKAWGRATKLQTVTTQTVGCNDAKRKAQQAEKVNIDWSQPLTAWEAAGKMGDTNDALVQAGIRFAGAMTNAQEILRQLDKAPNMTDDNTASTVISICSGGLDRLTAVKSLASPGVRTNEWFAF